MKLEEIRGKIPEALYSAMVIESFLPAQQKALKAGLLEGKSLLVCTPTASGKTLIAELAAMSGILEKKGKAIYIVPLKALATEKYKSFKERYGKLCKIALSIGDYDGSDSHLADCDLIITTSEKLDSLTRHRASWLSKAFLLVVDEIHLMNDPGRGPTLEILITIVRELIPKVQILALSATIGNPKELAGWLDAKVVEDKWRPVKLEKGIYHKDEIEFY
jgi:helicase